MANSKKNIIDRINYVSGYVVNETPKYRPLIDDSSFDSIPEGFNMKEADGDLPEPEAAAGQPPVDNQAAPSPAAAPAPVTPPAPTAAPVAPPAPDASNSISPALPNAEVTPSVDTNSPEAMATQTPSADPNLAQSNNATTDQLQADVLRFQLDAMKKMTQKIDQLESVIDGLNAQQAVLHQEVDKVRDPSDIEKFNTRKEDSSPYYFNLNDMWNGNTFQARMDNFNSKGIVKTPDGYVADFDKLPKLNAYEIKDSFEQV